MRSSRANSPSARRVVSPVLGWREHVAARNPRDRAQRSSDVWHILWRRRVGARRAGLAGCPPRVGVDRVRCCCRSLPAAARRASATGSVRTDGALTLSTGGIPRRLRITSRVCACMPARDPRFYGPLFDAMLVSAGYAAAALFLAYRTIRRREIGG